MEADRTLAGLVPVALDPACETISFVAANGAWFTEPFFEQSARRLLQQSSPVSRSFAAVHDTAQACTARPAGLIVHTARCGSTVLTKLVRHLRHTLVLGEPAVLGQAQRLERRSGADVPAGTSIVGDLLASMATFAEQRGDQLIVKLTSWQAIDADFYGDLLPDVPVVFVHRPVEQVVASLLADPPGWSPFAGARASIPWRDDELPQHDQSEAEWYASIWAMVVRAALALPASRVLLLDHDTVTDDPVAALRQVATHCALDGEFRASAVEREVGYYAKSSDPTEIFDPTGRHQRPPLDDRTLSAVQAIAADASAALEARR